MQTLNKDLVLKDQVTYVYTDCLKRVWMVLIAFTVICVPLGMFIKETVLRKVLETDFGLKIDERRLGEGEAKVGEVWEELREGAVGKTPAEMKGK